MRSQPAGRRNKYITIEESTEGTPDSFGAPAVAWTTFATRFASVMPESGREFQAAKAVHADLTHLIEMPYCSGVTAKMRVAIGTRYLGIVSVANLEEANTTMRLACVERV